MVVCLFKEVFIGIVNCGKYKGLVYLWYGEVGELNIVYCLDFLVIMVFNVI